MSTPPSETPPRQPVIGIISNWRAMGVGLAAGVLNGLMGIGGGIVIVPGLIFLLGASPKVAVSTSLATVLMLASVALAGHVWVAGFHFSLTGAGTLLLGGLAGAYVGGRLLNYVSTRVILYLFSLMAFTSATNLVLQGLGLFSLHGEATLTPPLFSYPLIGAISGFFSGMLGVGGGGLVVLLFTVFFESPILEGLPLALMVNIVNSGTGVLTQLGRGQILWPEALRMVPAALVGIGLGVAVAVSLPAGMFKVLFACFFFYVGLRILLRGLRT